MRPSSKITGCCSGAFENQNKTSHQQAQCTTLCLDELQGFENDAELCAFLTRIWRLISESWEPIVDTILRDGDLAAAPEAQQHATTITTTTTLGPDRRALQEWIPARQEEGFIGICNGRQRWQVVCVEEPAHVLDGQATGRCADDGDRLRALRGEAQEYVLAEICVLPVPLRAARAEDTRVVGVRGYKQC